MPSQPDIRDLQLWTQQLLEHRRVLFERVIAAFPQIATTRRSQVDMWRIRLRP